MINTFLMSGQKQHFQFSLYNKSLTVWAGMESKWCMDIAPNSGCQAKQQIEALAGTHQCAWI